MLDMRVGGWACGWIGGAGWAVVRAGWSGGRIMMHTHAWPKHDPFEQLIRTLSHHVPTDRLSRLTEPQID